MSRTVRSEVDFFYFITFVSSFFSHYPLGYVRKRHAYRTQLAEPDPTQVSDLKISHGKLVKKNTWCEGGLCPILPIGGIQYTRIYIYMCIF